MAYCTLLGKFVLCYFAGCQTDMHMRLCDSTRLLLCFCCFFTFLLYVTLRPFASSCHHEIKKTVDELSSSLTSIYEPHRIVVVSFYSEVWYSIYLCFGNP